MQGGQDALRILTGKMPVLQMRNGKIALSPNSGPSLRVIMIDGRKVSRNACAWCKTAIEIPPKTPDRRVGSRPRRGLMDVFLRERERLGRIAAGMGMDRADADDVLQDVSIQVLKNTDRFEQETVMTRWLITTTVNRCLTEHRRRFRHKASRILRRRPDMADGSCGRSPAQDRVGLSEELEVVRRTLAELDPSLLLAVVLRYFCDMSRTRSRRPWNGMPRRCEAGSERPD